MGLGKGGRDGAGLEALERMEQMFCYESALNSLEKPRKKKKKAVEYYLPFSRKRRILDLYCGAKWSKWERTASLVEGVSR